MPFKEGYAPMDIGLNKYTYPDTNVVIRHEEYWLDGDISSHEAAVMQRDIVSELKNFGIQPIEASYVAVKGAENYVAVTRKIENGIFYSDDAYEDMPADIKDKADQVIDGLYNYLSAKSESGEPFITDIFGLYQFMYDPKKQSFMLVDIGGKIAEDAGVSTHNRYINEVFNATILIESGDKMYRHNPDKFEQWQEKSANLLQLICRSNGMLLKKETETKLLHLLAREVINDEEFDNIIFDEIANTEVASLVS